MIKEMKTKNYLLTLILMMSMAVMSSCKSDNDDVALAGITLSKTSLSLLPETSDTLKCVFYPDNTTSKEVVWTSSDESVATIDNNGIVKSLKVGTAVMTATSKSNKTIKATCTVSVTNRQLSNVSGEVFGTWTKNTTVYVTF